MLTFAGVLAKFAAATVQCETPVLTGMLSGLQELVSVTRPCFLMNPAGIVMLFPPLRGVRLIRPTYWPVATSGALISIGKVSDASFRMWRSWLLLPTVIVTPAGAVM